MAKRAPRGMPPAPAMALSAYAPGELAKLTPEQRGRALKRSKRPKLDPALMSHLLTR